MYRRRSGKFGAVIRDSNEKGALIWLGTLSTAVEAAKAYDCAGFRLHGTHGSSLEFPTRTKRGREKGSAALKVLGSNAVLNIPLEAGKAKSKESELLDGSCKETKIEELACNLALEI